MDVQGFLFYQAALLQEPALLGLAFEETLLELVVEVVFLQLLL